LCPSLRDGSASRKHYEHIKNETRHVFLSRFAQPAHPEVRPAANTAFNGD
jgi:hypothetical protein